MQNLIKNNPDFDGQIYTKYDPDTQLSAIIAIHSLKLGPALGGCRWLTYPSFAAGLHDATRLAKGMSYKAAISGVPYGGGKAVLLKPHHTASIDRPAYFASFSRFINSLNGDYITTVDSGLQIADLDLIAKHTHFVTGQTRAGSSGDPSPSTAAGTIHGMAAAVKFKLKRNSLEGLHVLIQGLGSVGYHIAKDLFIRGVKLTVSDINPILVQRCVDEFAATAVAPDKVYTIACDIFSPCALGAILNQITIPLLDTAIIAGCANNQLASSEDGVSLHAKNILYVPDYVVNAGGLIDVAAQYEQTPLTIVNDRIAAIYDKLWEIFVRAAKSRQPTAVVADQIAKALLC